MKLKEAIQAARIDRQGEVFSVALACGFEPLHFSTFLRAELLARLPGRRVEVIPGIFGDLPGNIAKLAGIGHSAAVVIVEWADIDPRLGLRRTGGWGAEAASDIASAASSSLSEILDLLRASVREFPIILTTPTLKMAPAFWSRVAEASVVQLELVKEVAAFAAAAAGIPGVIVADTSAIADTPHSTRHDVSSDLATGFPYSLDHASRLAAAIASIVVPAPPKKGLITDLDDTIWHGIVGDDAVEGLSWDLENHSHVHALYQQSLVAIARSGGLIAVASKNDPALVRQAFERPDMLLRDEHVFPFEVNWQEKSASVSRILSAWNIGADDVVFVDDSPLELAEVAAAHPGIQCIQFEPNDPASVYRLIQMLQDLFGKTTLQPEDRLRTASIRSAADMRGSADMRETFLAQLDGKISFSVAIDSGDSRPLELLNKTNQFNLNGHRLTSADLASRIRRPGNIFLSASYTDRYGPLGRIAVLTGDTSGGTTRIDSWVMSCRAFSRRIEHRCLDEIFARTDSEVVELRFEQTERNAPFREFAEAVGDEVPGAGFVVRKAAFEKRKPTLHMRTVE